LRVDILRRRLGDEDAKSSDISSRSAPASVDFHVLLQSVRQRTINSPEQFACVLFFRFFIVVDSSTVAFTYYIYIVMLNKMTAQVPE